MGYSSQAGVTVFREQTAKGTPAADLSTAGVAAYLTSGAMKGNRELKISDPEIGAGRDITKGLLGAASFSGEYEFNMRFEMIASFLKGALGEADTVTTTGVNEHTFTPSDESVLPFYTIYERVSSGLDRFQYTDCVVNTLHLEADADGFLTGTVGIIGARQLAGVPDIDVSALYDNTSMTVGTNVTVLYDGVDVKAKSFSFDINNNFEDDDFRLGSFFLEDLTPKRREVNATMTLREINNQKMRQALLGASTATEAGGITTEKELEIQILSYENIVGSTPLTQHSLTITIPTVIFEPTGWDVSGDDIIETEYSMTAVRGDNAVPILTAVLKNGNTEIA
jgi:hypothetical protein